MLYLHVFDVRRGSEQQTLNVDVGPLVPHHLVADVATEYSEVAGVDLFGAIGEHAHRPNGELRSELAPPGFLVLVPAGEHDVAAVLHGVQQLNTLRGVGLHVVVHQQDEVAFGLSQTCHDSVVLA